MEILFPLATLLLSSSFLSTCVFLSLTRRGLEQKAKDQSVESVGSPVSQSVSECLPVMLGF